MKKRMYLLLMAAVTSLSLSNSAMALETLPRENDGMETQRETQEYVQVLLDQDAIDQMRTEDTENEIPKMPQKEIIDPEYKGVIKPAGIHDKEKQENNPLEKQQAITYYKTIEAAGEALRQGWAAHQSRVEVSCATPNTYATTYFNEIVAAASEHTGNPLEGDYLRKQYGKVSCDFNKQTYFKKDGLYHVTMYFDFTYYTTASEEARLTTEITKLQNNLKLSGKTDYEKIKAIYDYITKNVTYDYTNLNNNQYTKKYTAYAALINKTAVCQGYSMLFYRLALAYGIDCRYVHCDQLSHGWNIVRLDGKYYILDTTWDAGRNTYKFFLMGKNDFSDHGGCCGDEFKDGVFSMHYPLAKEHYIQSHDNGSPSAAKIDISQCKAELLQTQFVYDGTAKTPGVVVKNGSQTLQIAKDYVLVFTNNKSAGQAKVTINGVGNYTGSKVLYFDIIRFYDLQENAYYVTPVSWAVTNNVTSGTAPGYFSPNDICTRGQVVTFLWRAMGKPEPKTTKNPFRDVYTSDYYYKPVLWAVENGVTSGMDAQTFGPNIGCTRGQVATFLWRAEGKKTTSNSIAFWDVSPSAYYYNPVKWAVKNGITNGVSASEFQPDTQCTRGQIVTFLYRDRTAS